MIAALIIGVVVAFLGFSIAKGIAKPLMDGVEFARHVASGDLSADIDVSQKDEVGMLAKALREMILKLREIVSSVKTATDNVTAGSGQLSSIRQRRNYHRERASSHHLPKKFPHLWKKCRRISVRMRIMRWKPKKLR